MARRKREKKVASPEVEAQTEAALEERQASATDHAAMDVVASGVLAEALLSEGGGGEEGMSREEAARKEDAEAREAAEREELLRELALLVKYNQYGAADRQMSKRHTEEGFLKIQARLEEIRDEKLLADLAEGMLLVSGTGAHDFVEKHFDLIPEKHYGELSVKLLQLPYEMNESAELFLKWVLPSLAPKEQSSVLRNAYERLSWSGRKLLKSIFFELQLEQPDKDQFLSEVPFVRFQSPDLNFIRTHLGEVSAATRAEIVDRLAYHGYSLVEGESVEKVDSSLRLMREGADGFLLGDWRERNREKYASFDLADAATLQQALEEAAQRKFEKPLAQLGSGEMRELLSDATAKEIDEELRPKIEAEMEPSTFTLFVKNWTRSSDRANRCVEALSVKLYEKELGELSGDEFRELLGRDEELEEWINNDQFEQFKQEVEGELALREAELDVVFTEVTIRADYTEESQIKAAVAGFEKALKAMPDAAGYVSEALAAVREQMSEKIREVYEKAMDKIGERQLRAKTLLRENVADLLSQAATDMKNKKGKIDFEGEPWREQDEYSGREWVKFRGSMSGSRAIDANEVVENAWIAIDVDERFNERNEALYLRVTQELIGY